MMILPAKVGTMPGGHIRVKDKRKPPKVGDRITAMRVYSDGKPDRWGPQVWEPMVVDKIEDGRYFVSLF